MARPLKAALAVALSLGVIWSALWWVAAGLMISQVEAWITANADASTAIAHGEISRAGFPFEIAVSIPNVALSKAGNAVETAALRLHILPWAPSRLIMSSGAPATLTSAAGPVLRADRLEAALDRTTDQRERISLHGADLRLALPGQPPVTAERLTAVATRLPGDARPVTLFLDATGAQSAARPEKLDLKFDAALRGPIDALIGPPNFAAWRDAGGALELRDVTLSHGPAQLSGAATVTLDQALRPVPNGTLTLRGVKAFLDRLTALGITSPRDAAIGQTALTLLSKPGADGQPEVTLPLTGRDGWLSIGPLRVTRLPPLPAN